MCLVFPDGALANSKTFFFWLPNNLSVSLFSCSYLLSLSLVPCNFDKPPHIFQLINIHCAQLFQTVVNSMWNCHTMPQPSHNIQNCISVAVSPGFYSYQSFTQLQKIFFHPSIPDHLDIMETCEWALDNLWCPEYTSVHKLPRPACKLSDF